MKSPLTTLLRSLAWISVLGLPLMSDAASIAINDTVYVAEGAIVGYRPVTIDSGAYGAGQVGWGWNVTSSAVELAITTTNANVINTVGFCIDPFHWSTGASIAYTVVSLAGGPKQPAEITSDEARKIAQLWKQFYRPITAGMTVQEREAQMNINAGLQIIFWNLTAQSTDTVATDYFRAYNYNDAQYHVSEMVAWLAANAATAPTANLVALRCNTEGGQDYVLEVPDAGSSALLLLGSLALIVGVRRRL